MKNFDQIFGKHPAASHELPSSSVSQEFGEVNVRVVGDEAQVVFTILWKPSLEGCRTGIALDASASMRDAYGLTFRWNVPEAEIKHITGEFKKQGKIKESVSDGVKYSCFTDDGMKELITKGAMTQKKNEMQPLAQQFVAHLVDGLDSEGKTAVIYWACGDGKEIEVIGDFTAEEARAAHYAGPKVKKFGAKTHLLPPVQYFVDKFKESAYAIFVILTDGRIDDLAAVKEYSISLAQSIDKQRRNPLKLVLVGMGDEIDEAQMTELDDLDAGCDVDLWDHKIAAEMRSLNDIFAEIVGENQIVAPSAVIYDERGDVVKRFSDGLPSLVTFTMPSASRSFDLEVCGKRIHQDL